MKCLACSKDLNKKEVVFTEDKKAYCINPFTCNTAHPNSPENILERGGAVKMYTDEELENNLFERLDVSQEMKDRILKIATKPQSIRLSKYEIAFYLLQLQETKGFSSISESVRYCIEYTMQHEPVEIPQIENRIVEVNLDEEKPEQEPLFAGEETKPEPIVKKAKVTIVPKQEEVDLEPEKEEEKEKENEVMLF